MDWPDENTPLFLTILSLISTGLPRSWNRHDITQRKWPRRTERISEQLRNFTTHLQLSRSGENKDCTEIRDEFGTILTALNIDLMAGEKIT
jgi:hypothetical protein